MPHRIHPLLLALGGGAWPLKVQCMGTRSVSTDREVSDTVHVLAEMQGGWTFFFLGSTVNEQGLTEQVRGYKSTLYLGGKEPDLKPERFFAEDIDGGAVPVKDSGEDHWKHELNFIDCIRERRLPNCNMELAIRAQTIISLAEISEIAARTVLFDPQKRTWKLA